MNECDPVTTLLSQDGIPANRADSVCLAGPGCSVISCVTRAITYSLSPTGSLVATTTYTDSNNAVIPQPVTVVPCPPTVIALIPPVVIAPTPPVAALRPVTGLTLCLPDSTPIAVFTFEPGLCASGCQNGTGPVAVQGWLNLLTGVYTLGNAPTGTKACGALRSIELGVPLCDIVNGATVGTATPEYTYNDVGAVIAVRLIGLNGQIYVPLGVLQTCAASSRVVQLVHLCAEGICLEYIGYYNSDTGVLELITDANGLSPVNWRASNYVEGGCPATTISARYICKTFLAEDVSAMVLEETIRTACGSSVRYFDIRQSPMVPVDSSLLDTGIAFCQGQTALTCGSTRETFSIRQPLSAQRVTLADDVILIAQCPTTSSAFGTSHSFAQGGAINGNGVIPPNMIAVTVYNATCASINFNVGASGNFTMPPYSVHSLQLSDNVPAWSGNYTFAGLQGVACAPSDGVDQAVYVDWAMKV